GLREEVAQPGGGGRTRRQVERVDGGEARRQVRGMQVPSLVEAVDQRVRHVVEVLLPRGVHVRRNRQDITRPVGQRDAGLRQRDLHHVPREVARVVARVLPGGGDADQRG